jgi:hypothetical protein
MPSQTLPPLSVHTVSAGAIVVPQTLPMHVFVRQAVDCAGQSVAFSHPTHAPLPSHTLPMFSVQAAPWGAFVVPQQPIVQMLVTHAVSCGGQSDASVHGIEGPHVSPVLELACEVVLVVPELLDVASPPAPDVLRTTA